MTYSAVNLILDKSIETNSAAFTMLSDVVPGLVQLLGVPVRIMAESGLRPGVAAIRKGLLGHLVCNWKNIHCKCECFAEFYVNRISVFFG